MSIKNFGIIAPGNYSSIKNISLKKVTSKSITPSAVPEMVLESIKGIIHEPNPNIEDDEYIFVDSILNVEDEDYPFYEVNANKARIRINNISENVTSIYYVVDDNNANPHELTQNDIDSFNGFDITGGGETEFPWGIIKKITVYEIVNDIQKTLEFYVKLIGAVATPTISHIYCARGIDSDHNIIYDEVEQTSDGVYEIYKFDFPFLDDGFLHLNNHSVMSMLFRVFSNCYDCSIRDGRGINSQVIELLYNNEKITFGLYYDYENSKEEGNKLVPKNLMQYTNGISINPFQLTNINAILNQTGINLIPSSRHVIEDLITLPYDTEIKIRTYIAKDNGVFMRSDYTEKIIKLLPYVIGANDDVADISLEKITKIINDDDVEMNPNDFEIDNVIYSSIVSYNNNTDYSKIRAVFDCNDTTGSLPGPRTFSVGVIIFVYQMNNFDSPLLVLKRDIFITPEMPSHEQILPLDSVEYTAIPDNYIYQVSKFTADISLDKFNNDNNEWFILIDNRTSGEPDIPLEEYLRNKSLDVYGYLCMYSHITQQNTYRYVFSNPKRIYYWYENNMVIIPPIIPPILP